MGGSESTSTLPRHKVAGGVVRQKQTLGVRAEGEEAGGHQRLGVGTVHSTYFIDTGLVLLLCLVLYVS